MTALTAYSLTSLIVVITFMLCSPLLSELDPPDWVSIPLFLVLVAALVSLPASLIIMIWSSVK